MGTTPDFVRGSLKNRTAVQEALLPKDEVKPTPNPDAGRPNRYPGKCTRCGVVVDAGKGNLKSSGGVHSVTHIGECPVVDEPVTDHAPTRNLVDGETLFDGVYTLETEGGHRTFKLSTQPLDADFMPGKQILAYLSGVDNDRDYTRFGHVAGHGNDSQAKVWKRHQGNASLVADIEYFIEHPDEAEAAVNCFACGRTLTVPTSIYNGLGPDCAKKYAS